MANRRLLLQIMATALVVNAARAQQPATPFAAWARRIYEREIDGHAAFARGDRRPDTDFSQPFTAQTQALIKQAQGRAMPNSEPDGPILHVFLGWGALPGRSIQLKDVRAEGESTAVVDIAINGVPRRLTLTGASDPTDGEWRIADIDYGPGSHDQSYVARLRRMATWPKR